MRFIITVTILLIMIILLVSGCQEVKTYRPADSNAVKIDSNVSVPAKIRFTQLTEFIENWRIHAYIDVIDEYGSRIKAGCKWRFEIYSFAPRNSDPRGPRLYIWDDIDLTASKDNNEYWEDFLRSYKFDLGLPIKLAAGKNYVLDVTCFDAAGDALTDTIELKL